MNRSTHQTRRHSQWWLHLCLLGAMALTLLTPAVGTAQEVSTPDTVARERPRSVIAVEENDTTSSDLPPSPGGAFLRSVVLPGWGQAAYGAYFRGGVYFAAEAGSWFMLLKSIARLGEARDIERFRVATVRDSLFTAIEGDPELAERYRRHLGGIEGAVEAEIDEHPSVIGIRDLVDSRKEQREDWLVLTLFWMLASGVDAFVTAHLADFPARVNAEAHPSGRYDFGLSIPVGGR